MAVLAVTAPAAGAAVRPADGLVGGEDLAGMRVLPSTARWVAVAPGPVRKAARRGAATRVLGNGKVVVISRVVRGGVGTFWRALPRGRALLAERALGVRGAAQRVTWSAGGLTGLIVVSGRSGLAPRLRASVAKRVRALAARKPLEVLQDAVAARGGTPTPEQAATAFSLTVAPLPGLPRARKGGGGGGFDEGTGAIMWARQTLGRQPPASRAAIAAALAKLGPGPGTGGFRAGVPDWTPDAALLQRAKDAAAQIAVKLGTPLTSKLAAGSTPTQYDPDYDAVTFSVDKDGEDTGPPALCIVTFYPSFLADSPVYQTEIVTHEVFHCFQAMLLGTAEVTKRKWIIEGGADWVACNVVPNPEPEFALKQWLDTPTKTLVNRTYDGVGLWSSLSSRGVNLWPLWQGILKGDGFDGSMAAAQVPANRGAWARPYGGEAARGGAWAFGAAPCAPTEQDPAPRTPVTVTNGSSGPLKVPKVYAAQLLDLRSDADVVEIRATRGRIDVSSLAPAYDGDDVHDTALCTDRQGSCVCPPGSAEAGQTPPAPVDGAGNTVIALVDDSAADGAMGTIRGSTLEEYCGLHRKQLIVPDRSVGQVYLRQTRNSVLRSVDGLRSGSKAPVEKAQVLFLGGGGTLPFSYEVMFGVCNPEIFDEPAELAACRKQFPRSNVDQVGLVQTGSLEFGTKDGLGPGSSASRVMFRYGQAGCVRERPDDPESPWSSCYYAGSGTRHTFWGFTGKAGEETVLAVGVGDRDITPASPQAEAG